MKPVRIPKWVKYFFPNLIWDLPSGEKTVYLTFDDGPTPSVTESLLTLLQDYNVQATFFCLGKNVDNSPELFEKISSSGHTTGSHGYDHLNGFRTPNAVYIENARKGMHRLNTNLYRPPYGKITPAQIARLSGYATIVMWGIMSMDFDRNTGPETCLNNVTRNIYPGSIIVFHDTVKAAENMFYVLPRLFKFLDDNHYKPMPITLGKNS